MKAGNTLDTMVTENSRGVVRHFLQDVGSTFGSGANGPREYDEGYEYLIDLGLLKKRFFLLGFPSAPWMTVPYEDNYAIGRFEGTEFDPLDWKPRVPTAAFLSARADDNFWAARRVAAFNEEMIRALVKTGQYSKPADEKLLADVLVQRRDKIARTYMGAINPLIDFVLSADGRLSFKNAAVDAGVGKPPANGYQAVWSAYDNTADTASAIGSPTATTGTDVQGPGGLPAAAGGFVKISVAGVGAEQAAWNQPVDVYFRRTAAGWQLVGVDRMPAAK
jgi:hypothetical protein